MTTRVIHIRDTPPGWDRSDYDGEYVYIGRPGPFGNPVILRPGQPRGSTIERYRRFLWDEVQRDPEYARRVAALSGRTLVCYCKPKPCHGDVLARAADYLAAKDA